MKLESHMLYCYNRNPNNAASLLYYLYMIDSNTAFLFPQFKMLDVNDGEVLRIVNSRTCNFCADNLRLTSKYPCYVRPCTIHQDGRYKCLGLTTPCCVFPLYPDILDNMKYVEVNEMPLFTKGAIYKNMYTGKRYEYISQNSFGFDELLFRDCETQDIAIFQGDSLIVFEESESE